LSERWARTHGPTRSGRAWEEVVGHYHEERNYLGKDDVLLFPRRAHADDDGEVKCRERLGGLLKFYHREAA